MSSTVTCSQCAGRVLAGDRFCANCGAEVEVPTQGVAAPEQRSPWDAILPELQAATAGKYNVRGELGHGGMAAVFLANEIRLNRRVAIKVMSPTLMMGVDGVNRFRQEAQAVASLSHPNIVTIYTVEETERLHYFVMKFLGGPSLEESIAKDGPLPISVVQAWLCQVGDALAYAHRRGVVHRDIKPANILLDDEGNAIVTDFGIAKVADTPSLTRTGMTVGTPAYMSPEQCSSTQITGASDQYSLGIVAYEMLTGEPPFTGPTLSVLRAHLEETPRPINSLRPDCPEDLRAAVRRMLEKDPANRWPSMEDAVAALGGAAIPHDDPVRAQLAAMAGGVTEQVRTSATGPVDHARISVAEDETVRTTPPPPPVVPPSASVPAAPPPVAWVTLTSPPRALAVGQSVQLEAAARDAASTPLAGLAITWASSDPDIVAVSATGIVTGVAPGSATITVSCEGKLDSVTLTVAPPQAAAVLVTPTHRAVPAGRSLQLQARARSADGRPLKDRPVVWKSSNPGIADVDTTGLVKAVAGGTATITATVDGQSASAEITVAARKTAAPFDFKKVWWAVPVAAVILVALWLVRRSSSEPQIAPVASVRVSPANTQVSVGSRVELLATLSDPQGTTLTGRPVTWVSSDTTVATVSNGVVIAAAAGRATIAALAESGERGEATVMVSADRYPVATVQVTPGRTSAAMGDRFTFQASTIDAAGTPVGDRPITWTSSDTSVATVDGRGVVTTHALGRATITATSEGETGSATIAVTSARVASVIVGPTSGRLSVGDTLRLTARTTDRQGRALPDRAVTWASSNAAVATVSAEGLVTAVDQGDAVITGRSEGRTATTSITVAPVAVAGVAVSLPRSELRVGDSLTATVSLTAADGSTLTRTVTWSSSDSAVARVSNGGIVRALAPGSVTIVASIGDREEGAPLTVNPGTATFAAIVTGSNHSCGISPGGEASCWGSNGSGQVGGGGDAIATPVTPGNVGSLVAISSGDEHTCAIGRGGRVRCWGNEGDGRLGDNVTGAYRAISAGGRHTCAIGQNGTTMCWGRNNRAQLGDGSTRSHAGPSAVVTDATFDSVTAGGEHTCGLTAQGKAYCWGSHWAGQNGNGQVPGSIRNPTPVSGDLTFGSLSAGDQHTCGITTAGALYCWGGNRNGQVGDGSRSDRNRPVEVAPQTKFRMVNAGGTHTCALATNGTAYCWGSNDEGQLGDGTTERRTTPVAVQGGIRFRAIDAGGTHTCGVTTDRESRCWGANQFGQVGDGSRRSRASPVSTSPPSSEP